MTRNLLSAVFAASATSMAFAGNAEPAALGLGSCLVGALGFKQLISHVKTRY